MNLNRKTFIRRLGAGAAGLAAASGLRAAPAISGAPWPFASDSGDPEALWRQVRTHFSFKEGFVYFNCGGLGPASRRVLDVYDQTSNTLLRTVETGHALFEDARKTVATFLGAVDDEICFTRNATEGNSIVAAGLELKAGDEVIFESHAHPGGALPWLNQARRRGVVVKVFEPDPRSPAGNVERIEALLSRRTRVIQVSHITAPTGIVMPVQAIARLAQARGIWFHVDGAQSAGMIPFSLRSIGCDSYATSGHKWLGGPMETGVLFIRFDRMEKVAPSLVGSHSSGDYDHKGKLNYSEGARRHEYGTRNAAAIVALAEAVRFQEAIGRDRVAEHGAKLARGIHERIAKLRGVTVLTPVLPEMRASMTTFIMPGKTAQEIFDHLLKNHGFRCRPVTEEGLQAVRISTHVFNSGEQCERLAAAIADYAGKA